MLNPGVSRKSYKCEKINDDE